MRLKIKIRRAGKNFIIMGWYGGSFNTIFGGNSALEEGIFVATIVFLREFRVISWTSDNNKLYPHLLIVFTS